MIQRLLLTTMIALGAFTSAAQTGKDFPSLSGETLDGQTITIPYKGPLFTLVGMAYSTKAEEALRGWYAPIYDKFIAKRGIMDDQYNVQVYFVPMYIGLKQAAYESTLKELRRSNRQDLFPHILFYRGELEPYGNSLSMKDKQMPYFFLLNAQGQIIWHGSGNFTEKKMDELVEALD
jgi:hypothetical protein